MSPRTIARRLNAESIPCPSGKLWTDSTIRGQVKRGTGLINNELYIGRLVWNRLRYVKNPETGKRVSRINPREEWIITEVPELRIVDDELWRAVKDRQEELTERYATVIEATRTARANRLNGTHRPRHLLSGLLECGACGGPYAMRGQDRYSCSNHVMNGSCSNSRGIRRTELEERVLIGLRDHLMAPDIAGEAVRAWAEETNRLNRERSASSEAERKELAEIEKKIERIAVAIQDGAYSPTLKEKLHKLEARKAELTKRLATVPAEIPDIHPNVAGIYRRKVARLAKALGTPEERDAAAAAIRELIDGIVLTPGAKRGQLQVTLRGELGNILEWTENGAENEKTDTPLSGMSVSVVAGAGFEPTTPRNGTFALGPHGLECGRIPGASSARRWMHSARPRRRAFPSIPTRRVRRGTRQVSVRLESPSCLGVPTRLLVWTNTSPYGGLWLGIQRRPRTGEKGYRVRRRLLRLHTAPNPCPSVGRAFFQVSLSCEPGISTSCVRFPLGAAAPQRRPIWRREESHG